jgi:hypothetical protein
MRLDFLMTGSFIIVLILGIVRLTLVCTYMQLSYGLLPDEYILMTLKISIP